MAKPMTLVEAERRCWIMIVVLAVAAGILFGLSLVGVGVQVFTGVIAMAGVGVLAITLWRWGVENHPTMHD